MLKIVLAIGLLAASVMAQGRDPPGPPPPVPGRMPSPGMPGMPGMEREGEGDWEEDHEMPCPPRTGREWICKIDYWDNNENRVVDEEHMQKCDERDECYLGPIVQRYLNEPWKRKWMCGPKPCQWEGSIEGRFQSGMEECHRGDCTLGPHDIMINGTWEVRAMFCDHSEEEEGEEMEGEMEEMMGPMWAAPVCMVNSSLDGEEMIKSCKGGELCMRGPAYTFYKGTQYRVFMCTKTPSMEMPMMGSKTAQIFHKIHYRMGKIADALVMDGYVFRSGPHETMYHVGRQLMVLRNHLEYYEGKAKEMKEMGYPEEDIKLPEYVVELFNPLHMAIVKLHNQVVSSLGSQKAEMVMMPLRDVMDDFYILYKGEPDLKTYMDLAHQNIQRLVMKMHSNDLMSEDARTMYRSAHEIMMTTFMVAKEMGFDGDKLMEIKEDMGEAMVYVWMFMTGGHVAPGNTPESLARKMIGAFQRLQELMTSKMTPRELVEATGKYLMKLKELAMEGKLNTREGREVHDMVATGKLLPLRRLTDSLPNTRMLTPMLTEVVNNFNVLWNHITGGPTPPMSRPEMEIQKIWNGLEAMVEHLEEGERMMREMRDRHPGGQGPPMPGGQGPMPGGQGPMPGGQRPMPEGQGPMPGGQRPMPGGQRPMPGGQGPPMPGPDGDILREIQDRLADIGRRLGGDHGQGGPGQGGPGQYGPGQGGPGQGGPGGDQNDIRRVLEDIQRRMRDMMDRDEDRNGDWDGPGQGGYGQGGYGQGGYGQGGYGQGGYGQGGYGQGGYGQGGYGQGGQGQGRPGGGDNDDMGRRLEDIQRMIRDMMAMGGDRNEDRGGDDDDDDDWGRDLMGDEGMMDMMGMMGGRGGMTMHDMKAMSKADPMFHMEEPCDEPIWMRQIPMMDRMKWGRTDNTFLGPMPEESEDNKKK